MYRRVPVCLEGSVARPLTPAAGPHPRCRRPRSLCGTTRPPPIITRAKRRTYAGEVIHLHLGAADLARIRFAASPLWETVASIRTLTRDQAGVQLHDPWRAKVRDRLTGVDMSLLTAVVRPAGYIPDFLSPSPPRRTTTLRAGLAQIQQSDPAMVAAQLLHLADHPLAQQGRDRRARVTLLRELADDPNAAIASIVEQLDRYWQAAIAPVWHRVYALLQADLAYRLEQLAEGGAERLLRTLHPLVSFHDNTLRVVKYYEGHADLSGRGLLLVPCAFAWPDVIVLTAEPSVPTVSYSPRGLGRLWEQQADRSGDTDASGLADVLGATRATLLAQLDLPMSTTQIARQLALSAPTVSVHLRALQRAGILDARRDGRAVLYTRTGLGEQLVAARSSGRAD